MLGKLLINLCYLLRSVEVAFIAIEPISWCIAVSIDVFQILTWTFLLHLLPWLISITSILNGNWVCSCALLRLLIGWLYACYVLLNKFVGMLLQRCTLYLSFSEFLPRFDSTCRHSLYWHRVVDIPNIRCIIVCIEVVEEEICVLMVRVQMVYHFLLFIYTNADATLRCQRVVFSVEIFTLRSDFND